MNRTKFSKLLMGALMCSSIAIYAQNYQTMPIQSGLNADVIANGVGSSMTSTSTDVDGVSFAFVSKDFQLISSSAALTYGLPVNGLINSVVSSTPGLSYQLASYSANNSLKLSAVNDAGTIVFTTPVAATKLYMLSTSGSGASTVNLVVNFTDGTSQSFSGVSLADWYNGSGFAISGFGRINRSNDVLEDGGGTNPRLYQTLHTIDTANQTKLIQNIVVTKASGTGLPNIFAFSVDAFSTCMPPTLQTPTAITSNSANVSWTGVSSTGISYDVYYSTTNTTPASTVTPQYPAVIGTSQTLGSLTANTNYYYWVRSNCSGATSQSSWSFVGTFKTACGPVMSMFENFDSYATGSIVPDCWVRNAGTGTMSISSSSPASGTRNIYQTVGSSGTPSTVVLPEFSNVNAGTNWLRFKARVSAATGTLKVGYVTNPTDASTFTLIQSISLPNSSYTGTSEYTVIVPSTVPANARLAIQNTADGKGYYWDDVYWETVPSCFKPSGPTNSAVTANGATIAWTAPTTVPAAGYEVYYSTSNTAPANNVVLNSNNSTTSTSTSANLSTLTPATTYYVWVRSACSATDKSDWSLASTSFVTSCIAVNLPYTLDFENVTVPALPICTSNVNAGNGNNWTTASSPGNGFGSNVLRYSWNGSNVANTWFFTNGLNLTAGTQYTITYKYGNNSTTYIEKFKVAFGTSATSSAMINPISDHPSVTGGQQATATFNFTPSTTGIYYIGFNAYSAANQYNLFIDDISITATNLATNEASMQKDAVKIHPNPFSEVLNIADVSKVKSISVMDLSGKVVKSFEKPEASLRMSDLSSGMYLVVLNMLDGTKQTIKAIKK